MTTVAWIGTAFLLFLCATEAADDFASRLNFSCLRPQTPCWPAGTYECVASTGRCRCGPGYYELTCQTFILGSNFRTQTCNATNTPCSAKGRCYDRGELSNGTQCLCSSGYYGYRCDRPMLSTDCLDGFMRVYVRPWLYVSPWLPGPPYIVGTTARLSLVDSFVPRTMENWNRTGLEGFVGEFDHLNDLLAGNATVAFENSTVIVYTRNVTVPYNSAGPDPTDENVMVECLVLKPEVPTTTSTPSTTVSTATTTTTVAPVLPPLILSPEWSCQRPTTQCLNGVCNTLLSPRSCDCVPGYYGKQCEIPREQLGAGQCRTSDPCVAGQGVCYDRGGGAVCMCQDRFYGTLCQNPAVVAECDAYRMVVNLFPYGYNNDTWAQLREPSLFFNPTVCKMQNISAFVASYPEYANRSWEGFAAVFLHVGDSCAASAPIVSRSGNTTTYKRSIEVTYTPDFGHLTDQLIEVSCTAPNPPITTTIATTTPITTPATTPTTIAATTPITAPATTPTTIAATTPITTPATTPTTIAATTPIKTPASTPRTTPPAATSPIISPSISTTPPTTGRPTSTTTTSSTATTFSTKTSSSTTTTTPRPTTTAVPTTKPLTTATWSTAPTPRPTTAAATTKPLTTWTAAWSTTPAPRPTTTTAAATTTTPRAPSSVSTTSARLTTTTTAAATSGTTTATARTPSSTTPTTTTTPKASSLPPPTVRTTLIAEDGYPVNGRTLSLGSIIYAVFTLVPRANSRGVEEIRVDSCIVADNKNSYFTVVKNAHPQPPNGLSLYRKADGSWVLSYRVLSLSGSLQLRCSILLCTPGDNPCTQGGKNRKRQLTASRPEVAFTLSDFVVQIPWWLLDAMLFDD